jgi:hypothetical protein
MESRVSAMGAIYAELMAFRHNISAFTFDQFGVDEGKSTSLRFKDNLKLFGSI